MTKKDIAKGISQKAAVAQAHALVIVQLVLDQITEALLTERRIELRNFGVFVVKKRRARRARNPRTGAVVPVPTKAVVSFKAGRKLESRVGELQISGVIAQDDGDGVNS